MWLPSIASRLKYNMALANCGTPMYLPTCVSGMPMSLAEITSQGVFSIAFLFLMCLLVWFD